MGTHKLIAALGEPCKPGQGGPCRPDLELIPHGNPLWHEDSSQHSAWASGRRDPRTNYAALDFAAWLARAFLLSSAASHGSLSPFVTTPQYLVILWPSTLGVVVSSMVRRIER